MSEQTPEGPGRNVLRDGLSSRDLHIDEAGRAEFEELKSLLLQELQPRGALQMVIFNNLLHAAVGLRRTNRMEADIMARGAAALEGEDTRKALDLLAKYQARYERSYYRSRKELERLQAAARGPKSRPGSKSRPLLIQ